MLKYFKENSLVNYIAEQPNDWKEAIRLSCQQLVEQGYITEEYVEEIVENVVKFGPYIVIADQIAMPHAEGNSPGVKGTAIAFTKFPNEVIFHDAETGEDRPATLFFTLAAEDAEAHLNNITQLMDLLMEEENVEALLATRTLEDFDKLIEEDNREEG